MSKFNFQPVVSKKMCMYDGFMYNGASLLFSRGAKHSFGEYTAISIDYDKFAVRLTFNDENGSYRIGKKKGSPIINSTKLNIPKGRYIKIDADDKSAIYVLESDRTAQLEVNKQ
jgi:hypothetical protein